MKTKYDKTGFTLMELMIALGILGIGLVMIATAFPSAMLETKGSVDNTMATLIAENAVAICRIRLSHVAIKDAVGGSLLDQTTRINSRHTGNLTYPTNTPDSRYGWLLLARQATEKDDNDYQLVIVPYHKFLTSDSVTFSEVTVNNAGNQIATGNRSIGSPVICKADGTFAYVVDSVGNLSTTITGGDAFAVGVSTCESPAIGCYVMRTAVAP